MYCRFFSRCYTRICLIIASPPWIKNCLFSRGGGAIIRHHKNTFLGQKFQNIFFLSNFFLKYFFCFFFSFFFFSLQKLVTFWDKKFKIFFFLKKYFPKLFLHKNIFPRFFFTAEFSHSLGTQMKKNIFLDKKRSWQKIFFWICVTKKLLNSAVTKKNEKKYFYAKTILENIFLEKKNVFEFCVPKSD